MLLNNDSLGCFTASSIHKLFVGGKGSTRAAYILEKAEEIVTGRRQVSFGNKSTEHGEFNEYEGIEEFAKQIGLDVRYLDEKYYPWSKDSGATPDFGVFNLKDKCVAAGDIKCPTSTFFKQKLMILQDSKPEFDNCPKEYYYQGQKQMMSLSKYYGYPVKEFFLVRYLTSSEVDYFGNKHEFNLPLNVRLFHKKIMANEAVQTEIDREVKKAVIERDQMVEELKSVLNPEYAAI